MAYIYLITNKINEKKYVGQTFSDINERFQQHCSERLKKTCEIRPLYRAMNKYGIENFTIALIEECQDKIVSERESYWIQYLNTYTNGYNATLGGEGRPLYDYLAIVNKYLELKNQNDTANYFNCHIDTVRTACKAYNIQILNSGEIRRKPVKRFSLNNEYICSYLSLTEAAEDMINLGFAKGTISTKTHISEVCKGKRKTAYKHFWQFD